MCQAQGRHQEDSTPFVNEQHVGPSIPENHCAEAPQHEEKTCHLRNPAAALIVWMKEVHWMPQMIICVKDTQNFNTLCSSSVC